MAEYIEREKLLQDISETVVFTVRKGTPLPNAEMRGANKVIDRVKSATTEDVIKVVRCKDCGNRTNKGICEKFRQRYPFFPEDDFYCGFGELKELGK